MAPEPASGIGLGKHGIEVLMNDIFSFLRGYQPGYYSGIQPFRAPATSIPDLSGLFSQVLRLRSALAPRTMPGPEVMYHPDWFNTSSVVRTDPMTGARL
jgi:hypothetical protein